MSTIESFEVEIDAFTRPRADFSSFRATVTSLNEAKRWDLQFPAEAKRRLELIAKVDVLTKERERHAHEMETADRITRVLETSGVGQRSMSEALQANQSEALDAVKQFMARVERKTWLILSGPPGSGKTVASAWAVRAAAQQGETVAFRATSLLVKMSSFEAGAIELEMLKGVGLLVLDDFGAEHMSDYGKGLLGELMDARHESMSPTIVTTNLGKKELAARAEDRITDRWRQDGRLVFLVGKSMRR